MAKTINLAEKYSKQVQERFYEDSYTQSSFATDLDAEFVGVKTVRVYEVDTAPMNDYTRSGTSRYGTPKELNDNVYEFQMKKDRSFTYTIDKGNQAEQMNIKEAGKTLRRQMREVVTPEIDEYRMKVWAEQAGQHAALAAAPSKTTIVEALMDANVALDKKHVPKKNRTFYIDISYYKFYFCHSDSDSDCAASARRILTTAGLGGRIAACLHNAAPGASRIKNPPYYCRRAP